MRFDLSKREFSLGNARLCAQASADAYQPLSDFARGRIGAAAALRIEKPEAHVLIYDFASFLLIACRGTADVMDIITDANISRLAIKGGDVHRGFYNSTDSVVREVFSAVVEAGGKPVVITGHSLGGAQAAVLAERLRYLGVTIDSVYTFGKPRVGSRAWAKQYNARNPFPSFRVTNGTDPVPCMPWCLGRYYHEAVEIFMPDGTADLALAPSLAAKILFDAWELYRLWRDIQSGNLARLKHHPIERYLERLAA